MNAWFIILIIVGIIATILTIWAFCTEWENGILDCITSIFILGTVILGIICITSPIGVKRELIRQEKERQQILYQIEHITSESDRVKLNEWILTYNDWVNDVNTAKEMYGPFSWYYSVDMSKHTIINLV